MELRSSRKRKHIQPNQPAPKPNKTDNGTALVAKVEPPDIKPNRLLKVLVGDYVQSSSLGAVQDILKNLNDPAYFRSGQCMEGDTCRILIPEHIDSYAVHVVLLAALNPGMPLNCRSNLNGLTLNKLHDAVKCFKIDGHAIGLEPLSAVDEFKTEEIQTHFFDKFSAGHLCQLSFSEILKVIGNDFLAVPCELDVFKVVKSWCDHNAASRMTKEILNALLAEIRWDLLVDMLEAMIITAEGPLRDALTELVQDFPLKPKLTVERRIAERRFAETVLVFYADQNQAEVNQYNWDTPGVVWDIALPKDMKQWCRYKEMGPAIDGERILFRASSGKNLRTWSFSVVTKEVRYLFEQQVADGTQYPLTCIDGMIYAWDFLTKGNDNCSFKASTERSGCTYTISQPQQFREEAAFQAYNGKFFYCGGRNLTGGQDTVSTVEMYEAETNKWTTLPNMLNARRCFAAQVYDGHLYVTGGAHNAGTGVLNSCERLNLDLPAAGWELIGLLNGARYDHCMFVAKGELYVCGGFTSMGNNRSRQPSVERYNLQEDRWEKSAVALRWPITSCATFVMPYK